MQRTMTARAAGVTAILGPTNTGKTHHAIERMLAHPSGIIGLPLRLLAREVYGRLVERAGVEAVALITGEEKIKPRRPRYWVATLEAMPRDLDVSFVAIDEIQLAANLDRGHVFTDRLLNRRGRDETLVIGAMTMRRAVEQLLPGVTVVSRPRLSKLSFAGEKKLSRLPHRSAIVAFSAEEVYAIAELIRRQRGGAAVVLGALSPRTRNAQVALYQNGDVDYLIATDAIGMGLNLDLDHVAFAGDRKFDGWQYRRLNPAEMGQIAGRAGRHLRDGTFGTTGRCPPLEEELIEKLEDHAFDPIPILQWRNSDLDFSTIESLQASLDLLPSEPGLTRAPLAEDMMVLDIAARDESVRKAAKTRADVARLWDVCQVPDYRKVSPSAHAELALTLYGFVVRAGHVPDPWFASQLALFDRTEGDIDALSGRIAQVRTLTYIANRPDWLGDPEHWQGVTRQLEDRLSDALHEKLAQRFVDRRTSVLMRRLRENAMLEAEITSGGDVLVEGQHVGQLHGFRFTPDPLAAGEAARTLNAAAMKALAGEIEARADRFGAAVDESFALANDGTIRWLGDPVAKLAAGDTLLGPRARVLADEHLTGPALEAVQRRLDLWLAQHVKKLLGPLMDFEAGEGLEGIARGIAFQVAEALGVLERSRVADDVKSLDQAARGTLRKLGLRFGAYHIYLPALVKPAPRALAAQLWALRHGGMEVAKGLDEVPHLAASGRTSFPADAAVPKGLYRAAGFRVCGTRAVRVDILERLADLIRPAIAYRPGTTPGTPPSGTADNDGFVTTVQMTSLAGCSGEDFASILRALGYVLDRRPGPPITVPLLPMAAVEPLKVVAPSDAGHNRAAAGDDGSVAAGGGQAGVEADVPAEDVGAPGQHATEDAPETGGTDSESARTSETPDPDESPRDGADLASAQASRPDLGSTFVSEPSASGATALSDETSSTAVSTPPDGVDADHSGSAPAENDVGRLAGLDQGEPAVMPDPSPPVASAEPTATFGTDHGDQGLAPGEAATGEPVSPNLSSVAPSDEEAPVSPPEERPGVDATPPGPDAIDSGLPGATDPIEPVLIEVWRPHRTNHHATRRPDRNRGRPAQQRATVAPPGEPATADAAVETRPPERRDDDRRPHRDRRPEAAREPGRDRRPRAGASHAATARPDSEARPPRPEGGGPPRNNGQAKPRFEGRRDRSPERGDGGRDGGRQTQFTTQERPARERQPDPDSPFAKLLALKLELERKKEP